MITAEEKELLKKKISDILLDTSYCSACAEASADKILLEVENALKPQLQLRIDATSKFMQFISDKLISFGVPFEQWWKEEGFESFLKWYEKHL